jgi:hypothetical protein
MTSLLSMFLNNENVMNSILSNNNGHEMIIINCKFKIKFYKIFNKKETRFIHISFSGLI